jgi:hypothetical protein
MSATTEKPRNYGEQEFRLMTEADIAKIAEEIGAHFGHSSLHAIVFDRLAADAPRALVRENRISMAVLDWLHGIHSAERGMEVVRRALVAPAKAAQV